jgi:hypothetical protein
MQETTSLSASSGTTCIQPANIDSPSPSTVKRSVAPWLWRRVGGLSPQRAPSCTRRRPSSAPGTWPPRKASALAAAGTLLFEAENSVPHFASFTTSSPSASYVEPISVSHARWIPGHHGIPGYVYTALRCRRTEKGDRHPIPKNLVVSSTKDWNRSMTHMSSRLLLQCEPAGCIVF